ncbi:MAG: hypothetical protein WC205_09185 [Opitutaceae bacterium]|jgi:alpha-galactosidase
MNSPKIVFIGGGSYQWVPTLFRDIAVNEHLKGCTFVLHDLDAVRNTELADVCRIIARKLGSTVRVETEDLLENALIGADSVILCISTGGLDAMEHDIEIPKKYGIYQPVGDSTGPGGISRTLRNVPVVVGIARKMEELCPDAWLLNLSNPMGQIVRAIHKSSSIKVVGLCHEFMSFMGKVEGLFGLKDWKQETSATIAGVNHFAWITRLTINGRDGLEMLREHTGVPAAVASPGKLVNLSEKLSGDQVKFALFKTYGAMPYPGDRHLVEFFPHFLSEKTNYGADFGVGLTSVDDRRTNWINGFKKRIAEWVSDDPNSIPRGPSYESLAPILAALFGGPATVQPVTIPNEGQVANLPMGATVETLATFQQNLLSPHASGALPDELLALVHKHCVIQELTVEGALTGDRTKILQAMIADPLNNNNDYREIEAMMNELLEANRALLPQFFSRGKSASQVLAGESAAAR